MGMWIIHSKTWGRLEATDVHQSVSFQGAITVYNVTRDGKTMWEKGYLFPHDIKLINPPKEG